METLKKTYRFRNGIEIPALGFGTWQVKPGEEAYESVSHALKHGYRHIDTAAAYQNEKSVGDAIKDSGIPRGDVFITTKLPAEIKDYEMAKKTFAKSLELLGVEYVDLYLIHAPWPWNEIGKDCRKGNIEVYKALEEFYKEGKAKAIGVSNFSPDDIKNIMDNCEIVPMANQIGYFIGLDQKKTIDFCKENDIFIIAYSPLGVGYLLSNPQINQIAQKYSVSAAQICLRYLLQKGVAVLPKSIHEERIRKNTELDFEINETDMAFLDTIKGDPRRWE